MPKKFVSSALLVITLFCVSFSETFPPSQDIPGGFDSTSLPLFISLGFDDNKHADGVDWVVNELFADRTNNSGNGNKATFDGSPMKCDFYVIANADLPYPGVDYPTANDFFNVQIPDERPITESWTRAYLAGFGVNNHTYTHNYNLSDLAYDTQKSNMPSLLESIGYCSRYLVNIAGIPYSQIFGIRTPYLASSASSNDSYRASRDLGILYDCTDDNGMQGNQQADWARPYFPGTMESGWIWWTVKATENLWQVPNAIYPTSGPTGQFSVKGFDSGTTNGWPTGISGQGFFEQMRWAIDYHYKRNRAPLDLGLHSDYYSQEADETSGTAANGFSTSLAERRSALIMLLDYIESDLPDARIVKKIDIINWLRNPVALSDNSKNDKLTFKTDNPSGGLGGATTIASSGSSADISGDNVNVTVADQKDWAIDGYAGLHFGLSKNLSSAHSIRVVYTSSLPLELKLVQDGLDAESYQYGLPATNGNSRIVELTLTSDAFMQPRPISNETALDLSKVNAINLVATAFDSTMSGSFSAAIEVFGAGQITADVAITNPKQNSFHNEITINGIKNKSINVSSKLAGTYNIDIFGLNGQKISSLTTNIKSGINVIPTKNISAGCHIVKVSNKYNSVKKRLIFN